MISSDQVIKYINGYICTPIWNYFGIRHSFSSKELWINDYLLWNNWIYYFSRYIEWHWKQ